MPETALGSLPGVGATYFLSRLPGFYGYLIFIIAIYLMFLCIINSTEYYASSDYSLVCSFTNDF